MKQVALTLVAFVVLGLVANVASAQDRRPHSRPVAAHVAVNLAAEQAGHASAIQPVSYRYRSSHGRHGHHRSYRSHGPIIVSPPIYGHPTVIVPRPGHPPVVHPPIVHPPIVHPPVYRYRPHYYGRSSGFHYSTPGFSFGIRF